MYPIKSPPDLSPWSPNANLIDTRTAHGVNSYSYTVAPNERISIAYIYLTPENTVTLTGGYAPSNAAFCIGISNGNYRKQIQPTGNGYAPTFSVPSNGTYEIFILNTGNISFTVKGSYVF